jgi:hypothetical protein
VQAARNPQAAAARRMDFQIQRNNNQAQRNNDQAQRNKNKTQRNKNKTIFLAVKREFSTA